MDIHPLKMGKILILVCSWIIIFPTLTPANNFQITLQHDKLSIANIQLNSDINWTEHTKFIADDGASNDWFGISVDIHGEYAVIGVRNDNYQQGSAYVYKHQDHTWIQDQKLVALDGMPNDWFGISVAVYNDTIFVGADADDNENGLNAGSVYIYKKTVTGWEHSQKLIASDGAPNEYFGRSIDICKNTTIIGAYYDDNIAGSAYIFVNTSSGWIEEAKLVASDREPGDYFGISVAIQDNITIIGAYRDDNILGENAGTVYVFQRTITGWIEKTKFIASDGAPNDRFGISLTLDNHTAIIGAYYHNNNKGAVYIFQKSESIWIQTTKLTASDGADNDYYGRSVSFDNNELIIGAWGHNNLKGAAYVYQYILNWTEIDKITASDGTPNDRFAYQLAHHNNYLIIGAYNEDNVNGDEAGSAYLFQKNMSSELHVSGNLIWIQIPAGSKQMGTVTIENIGDPTSLLDWEIISFPSWGTWEFTPNSGTDLTPEAGPITVNVEVVAPNKQEETFSGNITVVNLENSSDIEIIDVSLTTPTIQPYSVNQILTIRRSLLSRISSFYFLT